MLRAVPNWTWIVGTLLLAVSVQAAEPYEGLSWEQRWEIADSLDQGSRDAADAGDLPSALKLVDAALLAHPSHYRSWMNRWILNIRKGLLDDTPDHELAALIRVDLLRIEKGIVNEDQVYVLTLGDGRLFDLTGDSTYLARREERLAAHVDEFPEALRTFDFHLILAKSVESDAVARTYFDAAQALATSPTRRRAWSQAAIERGIERPDFLTEDDIRATITQWHSTYAEVEDEGVRLREEANLVLWHGRLAAVKGDAATLSHLVEAFQDRRGKLQPHEEGMLARGWSAPVKPLAIMDARFAAMQGDLALLGGDASLAAERYRQAWQHIAPIVGDWGRDRELLSGEHMKKLRNRLLPYVE